MSDIPPITYAQRVAESPVAKAWHIVITGIGIPALIGVSGYGFLQLVDIKEQLAVISTYEKRLDRVEEWQTAYNDDLRRRPRFDAADGREMKTELTGRINRIEDRLGVVERRIGD